MDKKPVILEVNDLHVEFDTVNGVVHAVNGISYILRKGETLGIVGESGCGKSASVLSIMKLLPQPPARIPKGSIRFYSQDLFGLSKKEFQQIRGSKIAMIFQDPMTSLNPVLTIGFQICESLQKHLLMSRTEAIDRSVELLQMVGIPESRDRLNDYPHQFSGGMRQRVMIAMALSCNPSLIIADEPTTALDVTIQAQILELVKQLRDKSGLSLIWITHDLGIIANLADRVLVMYGGFIVEEACIDDLYNDPRHPYTAALLRSRPRMDGRLGERLENIKGMPPEMLRLIKGCPFAPRCSVVVEKCHLENPTLREVNLEHKAACWIDIRNGRST